MSDGGNARCAARETPGSAATDGATPAGSNLSWLNVTSSQAYFGSPSAGYYGSMAFAGSDGIVYFGGCDLRACPDNETWIFSAGRWTNLSVGYGPYPPARFAAAMSYDPASYAVVLYGGCGVTRCPLNDTWVFSMGNGGWFNVSAGRGYSACTAACPPALYGASMADSDSSQTGTGGPVGTSILFGGCLDRGCHQVSNQTWETYYPVESFHPWDVQWSAAGSGPAPPGRSFASMAYLPTANATFLFGGSCGSACGDLNDTWYFNSSRWHDATAPLRAAGSPAPPARNSAAITYDPRNTELLLLGGLNRSTSAASGDAWTFQCSGTCSWSLATGDTGPLPSFGGAVPANSSGLAPVFFGGRTSPGNQSSGSTWVLGSAPTFAPTFSPNPAEVNSTPLFRGGGATGTSYCLNLTPYQTPFWLWPNFVPECFVGDQTVFLAYSGTFIVSVTAYAPSGASSTQTFPLTVAPAPTVVTSATPASTDVGFSTNLTAVPCAGCAAVLNYTWWLLTNAMGSTLLGYGPTVPYAFPAPGTYRAVVVYWDGVNQNRTILSIRINPLPALDAPLLLSPTDVGVATNFSASASQGTGADQFRWDFGDGGVSVGSTVSHTFATAGARSAIVTVVDSVGGQSRAVENLIVNPPVTVNASAFGPPAAVGTNVTFAASASGGTAPLQVSWTFDDGVTAVGPFVDRSFATTGSHRVSVRVTDAIGGTAQSVVSVVVLAAESHSPSPPPPASGPTEPLSWLDGGLLLLAGLAIGIAVTWIVVRRDRGSRRP